MNYLAHAYLSFNHPQILVGNMISDYVKGKKQYDYPALILKGIKLHRSIDNYTDVHYAVLNAKEIFRPHYRLYASPIVDVVFDHFVAKQSFTENDLLLFTQQVYHTLDEHKAFLPERFLSFFPHMKEYNWLFNYRHHWGIERSLNGLVRRAAYISDSTTAFNLFQEHFNELEQHFTVFFEDVKNFAKHQLEDLLL
jgi:acyl carrier protein phosphodiesterase